MTVTVKNIIPAKQAENAQTGQYTALNCKTLIDKFTATNTSAANVVFSVNLVASGGTASAANRILSLRTISPGETYTCPELVGHSLEAGGFISTLCDTATSLTIDASGREIT
jgi:hypothetical protein